MEIFAHRLTALVRTLARKPGFAVAVILTLTIGIGANTATLSLLYGYLLAPLPYPNAGQLVQVSLSAKTMVMDGSVSSPLYFDMLSQSTALGNAGIYSYEDLNLAIAEQVVHVRGVSATSSLFATLGMRPLIGRVFAPPANQPGAASEIVLSYRLWSQLFNRNPAVLGRTVRLNDNAYTVIGVMPQSFQFPNPEIDVWIPEIITADDHNPQRLGNFNKQMIARLKPIATPAIFNTQAQTVLENAIAHYPAPAAIPLYKKVGFGITATPLRVALVGDLSQRLILVQLATGLLLLLVWFNLANLFIARALSRRGELILRRVLGADTRTLFRQLFSESLVLCVAGAIVGLIFGEVLLRILLHTGFGASALAFPVHEWGISAGIALVLAILSALVFSFAGLYFIRRQDLAQALREGDARSSGGAGEHRIRAVLVITQLVLACILTGIGAMLVHSLMKLNTVKLGFQPEHVITFQINLPVNTDNNATALSNIGPELSQLRAALAQVPGVNAATITSDVPFAGTADWESVFPYPWDRKHSANVAAITTDTDYFQALAVPLLSGRSFTPQDAAAPSAASFAAPQGANPQTGVAIIDVKAAEQMFGTTTVVGREFNLDAPNRTRVGFLYKVIGVAGVTHREQVGQAPRRGAIYLDRSQMLSMKGYSFAPSSWYVAVRTPLSTAAILPALSQAVARAVPGVPIYDVRSMDQRLSAQLSPRRGLMTLILMFAAGALLLAAVGLYAVQSYSISQRLREFGIRAALGADRSKLLGLVMREIAKLLVIGLVLGLIGAVLLSHVFSAALYDVNFADPVSLFLVFVILSFTALAAGWIPAWRASRVSPATALRLE
ncbi:MAG: ADOP family duplicated permease [Gammaproteobacteria bacterium]